MIIPLNIKYDIAEALAYYNDLQDNHQSMHWDYTKDHNEPAAIDKKNNLSTMHGWGLHTIYNDPKFRYHCDLDPHDEGPEWFRHTELVFGFAEKVFNFFPKAYRSCLYVHPPGTHIGQWKPAGPPHGKVIIPIETNPDAFLVSHEDPIVKVSPQLGTIYLIDTDAYTEVINNGTTDQTSIVFNAPVDTFDFMINATGQL